MGLILGTAAPGLTKGPSDAPALKEPMSPNIDPYFMDGIGVDEYDDRHLGAGGATYPLLRQLSQIPFVGAIVQTRINQHAPFLVPRADDLRPGFRVKLWDEKAKASRDSEKVAREITAILMGAAGGHNGYDTMESAITALVRDSLTYDQANFEVLWTRGGKPYGYMPVDASLMRLAKVPDADRDRGKFYPGAKDVHYVKLWAHDHEVAAEYTPERMAWGIRRPRTWEAVRRYGYPELEEAHTALTDLLDAMTYNSVNFKSGVHANTVLAIMSSMKGEQQFSFKNAVRAMLTGRRQAQKLPMFFLKPDDKVQGVPLGKSNKEMEFSNYISFLLKVLCAVYQMDPAELGFVFGNEGQTHSLQGAGPGERIIYSQERGLHSLLRHVAWWLTSRIVRQYHPDFCVEFVGLDAPSDAEREKRLNESAKVYKTPNEIRAEHDLPKLSHPAADTPLDPAFAAAAGGPDDEGGDFPPGMDAPPKLEDEEPFGKGIFRGRMTIDEVTTRFVEAADEAAKQGRLVLPERRSATGYKFLRSNRRGVIGHIVERAA